MKYIIIALMLFLFGMILAGCGHGDDYWQQVTPLIK